MFQNNKNLKMSNKKVAPKPFCKVCFDAGKSEAEYTSHFVKSEPGAKAKVVCPTLLNQACTYCRETGHTVSHCVKLKQNNKNKEHAVRVQEYTAKKTAINNSNNTISKNAINGFDALAQLDAQADELDTIQLNQQKAYPALVGTPTASDVKVVAKQTQVSYANMAARTGPSKSAAIVMSDLNKLAAKAKAKAMFKQPKPVTKKSWADWTDSDDDDDDEEEVSDCECGHCDF
jgi:hypothetical protein